MGMQPRRRRVPKWLVLVLLGALGCCVALLLTLMYFLYWMTAPVPLPPSERARLPQADFSVTVRPDLRHEATRRWVRGCLARGLREAPRVARRAAEYALRPERAALCPMAFVMSGRCKDGAIDAWVCALSLGRYRGAFWLADRELHKLARQGRIPYGLHRHGRTWFYEQTRSGRGGPPVLGLWRATALAGSHVAVVARVYDQLASAATPSRPGSSAGQGEFGTVVVARPQEVLPAVLAGDLPAADAQALGAAVAPFRAELAIDDRGVLHVVIEGACKDPAMNKPLADEARRRLQRRKEAGRIEAFEVRALERTVRLTWQWRAPWAAAP